MAIREATHTGIRRIGVCKTHTAARDAIDIRRGYDAFTSTGHQIVPVLVRHNQQHTGAISRHGHFPACEFLQKLKTLDISLQATILWMTTTKVRNIMQNIRVACVSMNGFFG
jgi:hypothetical protein